MKVTAENFPVVFITPEAKQKLDLYIRLCENEISGLGKAEKVGDDFLITDVMIFEQEVTAGSTDLDPDTMQNFLLNLVELGEDPEQYKLWWHSHGNGGTFWSKTDDTTARKFDNGWMISIVGNRKGEYRCRVDLFQPVAIVLDEIDFRVQNNPSAELIEKVFDEINDKVKVRELKQWDPEHKRSWWGGVGFYGGGYGRSDEDFYVRPANRPDDRNIERRDVEHRPRPLYLGGHDTELARENTRGPDIPVKSTEKKMNGGVRIRRPGEKS